MSDDINKKTTEDTMQEPQVEEVKTEEVIETETVVEPIEETITESNVTDFRAGDTVKVYYKIIEGNKTRTQPYEGIVIARKGKEMSQTFTVRRIAADNVGVERIFPLHSPNIEKIEVLKRGKVRKSKLYYLRGKQGREAMRIRELGK